MGNLYISAYGRSNVGKKRGNKEDNFYLSGITVDSATDITSSAPEVSELGFAVFDGMEFILKRFHDGGGHILADYA